MHDKDVIAQCECTAFNASNTASDSSFIGCERKHTNPSCQDFGFGIAKSSSIGIWNERLKKVVRVALRGLYSSPCTCIDVLCCSGGDDLHAQCEIVV